MSVTSVIRFSLSTLVKALESLDKETLKRLKRTREETVEDIDKLQDRCLREIALKQPFGKDFRRLAALLKISTSLERIARYISHAAEYALQLEEIPKEIQKLLVRMAFLADKAVSEALEAFESENLSLLSRSDEIERLIDETFEKLRNNIISRSEAGCKVKEGIYLAMIARTLERIGDHAVEIVRRTEYYLRGELPWGSSS